MDYSEQLAEQNDAIREKEERLNPPSLLHHDCDSTNVTWAKYHAGESLMYLQFRGDKVYGYRGVPAHIFEHLKTVKESGATIGLEKAFSEYSFLIHHLIGDRHNPLFEYWLLSDEEKEALLG